MTLHGNRKANINTKSLVLYVGKATNKTVSATKEIVTTNASKTCKTKKLYVVTDI